jgi:hypothetical protein
MSGEQDQGPTVRLPHLSADEVEEKTAKEVKADEKAAAKEEAAVKADEKAAAKEESKPTASAPTSTQHSNK